MWERSVVMGLEMYHPLWRKIAQHEKNENNGKHSHRYTHTHTHTERERERERVDSVYL